MVLKDWHVVASKSGRVTIVGNEKNRADPNHGIVQIKHPDGKSTRYTHAANIKVKEGQEVAKWQRIANPSCEHPPDGNTTGVHLDFMMLDQFGKRIDSRGITLSGWKVKGGLNYQGTMEKDGEKTRTASTKRCATDSACGGLRNDLIIFEAARAVLGVSATPTPRREGSKLTIPTTEKPNVEKKISISKNPDALFKALLTSPIPGNILPERMILKGTSASPIDDTGQAPKQISDENIIIEDHIPTEVWQTPSRGGVSYLIFPDSSTARSASELLATHLGAGQVLEDFSYPTNIYAIQSSFMGVVYMANTVLVTSMGNVTMIISLTGTNAQGVDILLVRSRAISLGHAAIAHLEQVGK